MDWLSNITGHREEPSLYDTLCAKYHDVVAAVLPIAFTVYWYIFIFLFLTATVGRKLKLRRFYIMILERVFSLVAVKMEEQVVKEKIKRTESFGKDFYYSTSDEEDEFSSQEHKKTSENTSERQHIESGRSDTEKQRLTFSQEAGQLCDYVNTGTICGVNTPTVPQSKGTESINTNSENQTSEIKDDKWCDVESSSFENSSTEETTQGRQIAASGDGSSDSSSPGGAPLHHLPLDASMLFASAGIRAILDDCVNSSFSPEQLKTWNLLSRNIMKMRQIRQSKSLAMFYFTGLFIRYVFLMPMRVLVLLVSLSNLTLWTFLVGCLPDGALKRTINSYVVCWGFDFVAGALSVVARFHNKEHRPPQGIAVANHTSPIDSMILATDNCYDMVGQKHRGLLGAFMRALSKSSAHIWFERSDARDRAATTRLLTQHAQDPALPPILIFPEGVCVNNTAVIQFRKGAFEIDAPICPIAIRFDPVYGDAYWFVGGFASYCFSLMTSWAIVCDVIYLPPTRRLEGESASQMADRVRSSIAKAIGVQELEWSSLVKGTVFNLEKWDKMRKEKQEAEQERFVRSLSQSEDWESDSSLEIIENL